MENEKIIKEAVILILALFLLVFLNNWVDKAYDQSTREATVIINVPDTCKSTINGKVFIEFRCLNDKSFDVVVRNKE